MKICEHRTLELTTIEWFKWAKDKGYPWAESGLDQLYNREGVFFSNKEERYDKFYKALGNGFSWYDAVEKSTYWRDIYYSFKNERI